MTQNLTSKNGQVEYANLSLSENWSVSGEFWSGGTTDGGDAFYIYAFANGTPLSEDDNKGQYSINYDEYQDQIQLMYAGSILKTVSQSSLDNSTWRQFKVVCTKGKFQVYLDNSLKLEYDDSANYTSRSSNNLFGFGARTGGIKNLHAVRNMQWYKWTMDFENVYLATNDSTKAYNKSLKKIFKFKNTGHSDTKLKWSISGPASPASEDLAGGSEQTIDVWLEPTGAAGTYTGTIIFTSTRGDVEIAVSAKAYQTSQPSYVGPAKGTNDRVNVAQQESVQYEVKANGPSFPGATLSNSGYRWKIETTNFGGLSDPKKSHTFPTSGLYEAYCLSCEMANGKEVNSDALDIPIRVWIRPQVNSSPPQSAIDDGLVSWYDNKYVGVKGEPVYLMADGQKGSTDPNETITKYLWDFDNDGNFEEEQPAGQVITHIWDSANLSGSIKCKAVTNYGVKGDEKVFSLKIYETAALDAKGPYTGKPNKAVELVCAMNQTAYPGATFEYQWRVNGTPTDGTLKGSATQAAGSITLTPNQSSKNGQVEYANLQVGNKWSVSGEFWSGGGSGADAFYIYAFATETPTSEDSAKKQYSINYNEYQDQIQLKYDGVTLGTVAQTSLDNSQWRQFAVRCDQGVFKIYLDHQLKLEYNDSANYATRTTNKLFGFGARTDGGANNYHRLKNMKWTLGTTTTTDGAGKAKYTWTESGTYSVEAEVVVQTAEGLVIISIATATATVEAGKPTAMPGGPYRGGIDGGNYSPIQFSGNNPDYIEDEDIGKITVWDWTFPGYGSATIYNPTCSFDTAGKYTIRLKVRSEYGKWSSEKTAEVNVIDGKIAGYVRAADLRTPVKEVKLTLSSSHVNTNVLANIAADSNGKLHTTGDGSIWTLTDENGYYEFVHIPLGSYRVRASKGEGDNSHEFQTNIKATEITLDAPNQLAIDFVDISVYPVGGRIVYSLQKNGMDVLVEGVKVKAQSAGGSGLIESLLSDKSLSVTGVNYSMPLFAGQYFFLAERSDRDIRIKKATPGYNEKTQLVTISSARTDIDFIDYTTRKLTVFVQDSGGYKIASQTMTISGDNGQAEGVSDENDGKFEVNLNPGKYTVKVQGADPEEKEVDVTGGDEAVKMTIPSKIELSFSPRPKLLDVPDEFLEQFGLKPEDNPEGYMYYYSPAPRTHIYIIKATSNGHPVEDFTLFVTDEVGMMTPDPPEEQELFVKGEEGEYKMTGGLPKKTTDDPPLAATKTIKFRATKNGYKESDKVSDNIIVLGDVLGGSAAKIVSIPTVNYTVLHDPPGDGSYAFLDDSMTMKGIVGGMEIKINDTEIPVYPSPWKDERKIKGYPYDNDDTKDAYDLYDKGLLGYQDSNPVAGHFTWMAAAEVVSGAAAVAIGIGPLAYLVQVAKLPIMAGLMTAGGRLSGGLVQYEISPNRHLETPSGDELPDLLGPGKGDVYYGEGWTLGLQTKYRLGIKFATETSEWELTTEQIETYDILERTNQYIYTIRDIENIIKDLTRTIAEYTDGFLFDLDKNDKGKTLDEGKIEDLKDDLNDKDCSSNLREAFEAENCNLAKDSKITVFQKGYLWGIEDTENSKKYYVVYEDKKLKVYEGWDIGRLIAAKNSWQNLLDNNLAYVWNKDYLTQGKSFEDFKNDKGGDLDDEKTETLIFSAGPKFEYSRAISRGYFVNLSQEIGVNTSAKISSEMENNICWVPISGAPIELCFNFGAEANIASGVNMGVGWENGQSTEQCVGFVLNDDDVGDNYSTRVYADPRWGTPIFFQDAGSISSDPWEKGTNKAVDLTLNLIDEPANNIPFDYQDGAHYKVKVTYTGMRELQTNWTDFVIYSLWTDNPDNLTVHFNGQPGPYQFALSKQSPETTFEVSLYPPKSDQRNSEEKEYSTIIEANESADCYQINRVLTLKPKFTDLRAPRAVITAPYAGERVSPALFPADDPFKIQVVSADMDIAGIQLQIRSKQPDGVWEPWRNLSGMKWEGTNTAVVTLFEYLDRVPQRREFTFKWTEAEMKMLGVGEYAIRAVATDKATKPNTDLDPPDVVFLVDESKPSVLTSIPDYQASEAERIYRGELSVLFTDDMRAMDFTDRTFSVVDLLDNNKKVSGYVSYSPALRKAIFVPIVPFTPYGYYRVEIKTDVKKGDTIERGVHDLAGNPLDNAFMWTFRTKDAPFEQVWSIGLSVTDGIALDGNNLAGVEYGASDNTDEKDAPSVPAMAGQMRLSYLDRQKKEFDRDIRPADGRLSHHWFFVVNNAEEYATVTLSWQPAILLTKTNRQYQVMRLVEFDSQGNVTNNISLDPTKVTFNQYGDPELTEIYSYVNKGETSRYFRLDVQKVDFVAKTFKKGSSGWRFFSAPVTPQRAEPFVNLGDDIDPFRLYQYNTKLGGYKIYLFDLGEVSLQTRYGYWTQLDKDVEVDVGGASNFNDMSLELNTVGWQAIGNPFILPVQVADLEVCEGTATAISFDEAVSVGLIEGTLYRWDIVTRDEAYNSEVPVSDSYEAATNTSKLEPWEGYWLKTKKPNITVIIPTPPGVGTATVETPAYLKPPRAPRLFASKQTSLAPQFNLCVEVFSEGASDKSTILGTHRDAKPGQDDLDSTEPPVMGQTVAAYFRHSDWGENAGLYNQDYQSTMNIGEQRLWQLTVYTDKPNTDMTVSWEKAIAKVPQDITLSFRKVGETIWQDMRQVGKVEFTSSSLITKLNFEIQAERIEKAVPLVGGTRLLPCYPNPFQTGVVSIPYELAESSAVEIKIYNIAGELVQTLDSCPTSAGSHVVTWDGCNQSGERVASGIYFYVFKAGGVTAVRKMGVCR